MYNVDDAHADAQVERGSVSHWKYFCDYSLDTTEGGISSLSFTCARITTTRENGYSAVPFQTKKILSTEVENESITLAYVNHETQGKSLMLSTELPIT